MRNYNNNNKSRSSSSKLSECGRGNNNGVQWCVVSMLNRPVKGAAGRGRCHNSATLPLSACLVSNACQPPSSSPSPALRLCIYEKSLKLLHWACWHLAQDTQAHTIHDICAGISPTTVTHSGLELPRLACTQSQVQSTQGGTLLTFPTTAD